MGEFTGIEINDIKPEEQKTEIEEPVKYPTDVPDLFANGIKKNGMEEYPVFDVTPEEFFSNMTSNRQRIRFKSGGSVQQYMQKTRNRNRPFYIKTNRDSKEFLRKVR